MPLKLSRDEIDRYERDGIVFPIRVLAEAEVARFRRFLDEVLEEQASNPDLGDYLYDKSHLLFPWYYEFVHQSAILDAVEDILGPDLLLWTSSILIKRPRSRAHFTWHQDATYWFLDPPIACTAWVALGEVTREDGGMRVIPGTHEVGQLPHVDTFDKDVMLLRGQKVAVPLDEDRAADVVLRPGEMSIHHTRVVHGSGPNRSQDLRVGCSMVFIPPHVRPTRSRECATLVRGRDVHRNFDSEPRPSASLDAAALEAHRAVRGRMETYNIGAKRADAPG